MLIALAALAGAGLLMQRSTVAAPDCPASWPAQDHQGFYTDAAGAGWFIIRSSDSNGYATVRAYAASDRYASGYVPNSPDRMCYLLVRRAGDAADLAEPRQLDFPSEPDADPAPEPTAEPRPPTLVELLARLSPAERQAALLCMLPLAGNRTLEELNRDPDFLAQVIALGCLTP